MGEKVLYWVGRLIAALGGVVPRDPAEVLKVLGSLLRADPAEKARFVEDAHAAWVGGGWAIRGDSSPETRVWTYAASTCTGNRGLKSRLSLPAMSLRRHW
jgi:hypothetical protein